MPLVRPRVVTGRELEENRTRARLLDAGARAAPNGSVDLAEPTRADNYMQRLIKYIPADVVALYVFLSGLFRQHAATDGEMTTAWSWIVLGACALLAFGLTYVSTAGKDQKTQWFQVLAAPVALCAWAFALGGPFELTFPRLYDPRAGSAVLAITALGIPMFDQLIDLWIVGRSHPS